MAKVFFFVKLVLLGLVLILLYNLFNIEQADNLNITNLLVPSPCHVKKERVGTLSEACDAQQMN